VFRVSDRTGAVSLNVPSSMPFVPMTQAMPSARAASQVSRIEPRSDVGRWTTWTPVLRMEVGTLASGNTARITGARSAMISSGVRHLRLVMRNCGYALAAAVVEVAERGPTTAQVALDVGQREGRTLGGTDGDCCGSAAELREGGGSDRIGSVGGQMTLSGPSERPRSRR